MNIVKVDEFEILENNGELAIKLPLSQVLPPIKNGRILYDGKNCAILLRDDIIYLLPNIVHDARDRLKSIDKVMIIETIKNDITASYMVSTMEVPDIPYKDNLEQIFLDTMKELKEKYGADFIAELTQKIIGIKL